MPEVTRHDRPGSMIGMQFHAFESLDGQLPNAAKIITTVDWCDGKPQVLRVFKILDDCEEYAVVARTIAEAVALYRAWREDEYGEQPEDWQEPDGGAIREFDAVIVKPNYAGPTS